MVSKLLSTKILARAAFSVLAVLAVIGIGMAIERHEASPYLGEPSRGELSNDFQFALGATGKTPPSEVKSFHRGKATGLSSVVELSTHLNESMDRILRYMNQSGWILAERKEGVEGIEYLKFCKHGVAVFFDSRAAFSAARTQVGVVWAENPNHYGYCPRPADSKDASDPIKAGQG